VFKTINDVFICLVADALENELLVSSALTALTDSLNNLFENELKSDHILCKYDEFLVLVDVVIDNGF
jgi:hypothetical protein